MRLVVCFNAALYWMVSSANPFLASCSPTSFFGTSPQQKSKDGVNGSDKPNKQAFTTSKVSRSSSSSRYQNNTVQVNNSNTVAVDAPNGNTEEEKKRKADSKASAGDTNATNGDSKRRKRSET